MTQQSYTGGLWVPAADEMLRWHCSMTQESHALLKSQIFKFSNIKYQKLKKIYISSPMEVLLVIKKVPGKAFSRACDS